MKGTVFTEFLEYVEQEFSPEHVDNMIDACTLESGGAYTSGGIYHHTEMVQLLNALSDQTGLEVPQLLTQFGDHLMGVFAVRFSNLIDRSKTLFDFLSSVDEYIHRDVQKLYPDTEMPSFVLVERSDTHIILNYQSKRCLSSLAKGLIMGAARLFKTPVNIVCQFADPDDASNVCFIITAEQGA